MIRLYMNHSISIHYDTIYTNLNNTIQSSRNGFSMIAPFYGQDLLGGPHGGYKPIDDWKDLRNNNGEGLLIGVKYFDSVPDSGASFVHHVPCMEMQAGFSFMVSAVPL
jgi:hypothetical protein